MRQIKIEERKTVRSRQIDRYFNDLNHHEKISPEEEVELAKRIKMGDQEALNRLVEANLRFVVSVAKQYAREPEVLTELIAQGNLGLIEAAQKYDHSTGFKFISYAVWYIRKEILVYFNNFHKTIRISSKIEQDVRRIKNTEAALEMKLQRPALIEEVEEELARTGEAIARERIQYIKTTHECAAIPLEAKTEDSEWSPIDWLGESDESLSKLEGSQSGLIEALLKGLTPTEAEVVKKHLGLLGELPKTHRQLGEDEGKSTERSRAIFKRAVKKMKKSYPGVAKLYA